MSQGGVFEDLYHHNLVLAKVNGVKMTVSSTELRRLMDAGYDVEVVAPM
jgi:hypothetical protein